MREGGGGTMVEIEEMDGGATVTLPVEGGDGGGPRNEDVHDYM